MDANNLLIWLVGISTIVWIVTWLRLQRGGSSGWLLVSCVVLSTLAAGLLLVPDRAGYLAAAFWFPFFLLPMLLLRLQHLLLARQRYRAATALAWTIAILHPADGFRRQPRLYGALALLAEGRIDDARRSMAKLGPLDSPLGRLAHAQLLRAENRWEDLVAWVESQPASRRLADANIATWYVRALCETGRYLDGVRAVQALPRQLQGVGGALVRPLLSLFLLAFGGRVQAVERLLAGPLRSYSPALGDLWRATALQAAGRTGEAEPMLLGLRAHPDALIRSSADRRLSQPLAAADPAAIPEALADWLDERSRVLDETAAVGSLLRPPPGRSLATPGLVLLELAVFLAEVPGGTTDAENLIRLGAMYGPADVLDGQYWRLVTANFLHFGALHLVLNLFGIWYFGRYLERVIGSVRLLACYLLTGVAALGTVLAWTTLVNAEPYLLVGASASVMGLAGCTAAILLQRVRTSRSPSARRDLLFLAIIFVLQSVFDLATPQVSFAAHAGGALYGLVVGLVLARRLPRLASAARPT